jgi:hypothetical protein
MHSEAPPPGDHDMPVGDVKSFFAIAQSAIEKTDFLLDLHYNNICRMGTETIQKVCELHAIGRGFETYLGEVFRRVNDVPDTAVFRITSSHTTTIVQMTFSITEAKFEVTKSGVNLEDH